MNSSNKKTALVIGATGLIGRQCVAALLQNEQYDKVTTLARRLSGATHPNLNEQIVDFDKLEDDAHLMKVDDVFCCLGTTIKKARSKEKFRKVDYEYPLRVAELALQQGAKQYLIVTAMGAAKKSPFFYNQVKGEIEEALKNLDYPSLHIFQPSLLTGGRKEFRLGEKMAVYSFKALNLLLHGPLKKYRSIEGKTVAKAMVKAANSGKRGTFVYESDVIEGMAISN